MFYDVIPLALSAVAKGTQPRPLRMAVRNLLFWWCAGDVGACSAGLQASTFYGFVGHGFLPRALFARGSRGARYGFV